MADTYPVHMDEMSPEFMECWKSAGKHLIECGVDTFLRAHPYPPILDHFSFRLGNQLFFLRVEDVKGQIHGPGTLDDLAEIAKEANGHACVLPMKQRLFGKSWVSVGRGYGLLDAKTRKPLFPKQLVTHEPIEMTEWERHDFGVQVVRDYLQDQGYTLMSWSGDPRIDPSIWFVGESKSPEWVVVRTAMFPENRAHLPADIGQIAEHCAAYPGAARGHFASVGLVSGDQPFAHEGEARVPLWRALGMHVAFSGLEEV